MKFKPGDTITRIPFRINGSLKLKHKWKSKCQPWPGISRNPGGEYFYVRLGELATVERYNEELDEVWVEGVGVPLSGKTFRKVAT